MSPFGIRQKLSSLGQGLRSKAASYQAQRRDALKGGMGDSFADIATAQDLLQRRGTLDSIDLVLGEAEPARVREWLPPGLTRRGAIVAGVCLVFWLTEIIPLYATTLILWVGMTLLLGPLDTKRFGVSAVISSAAHPVMGLFFGGFALSVAASKFVNQISGSLHSRYGAG